MNFKGNGTPWTGNPHPDLAGVKGWDTVTGKDTIVGLDKAKNVPD